MRIGALVLVGSLFVSRWAAAATAVFPIDSTNLEPGEQDAIGQLVAAAYQSESKDAVIPPKSSAPAYEEAGGYKEAAQKLGATDYLTVTAVRLGQRIVLNANRYSADGTLVHSVKMTASSLDDVEPVSDRLAKALFNRTSTKETQSIDNVSANEGKRPNRTFIEKVMGIKAGFTYAHGYGHEIAPMMSFGFDGRLEGKSYFLEVGVGFTVPSTSTDDKLSYGGLYSDIGVNFYLANSSIAPYLGGGVLPRLVGHNPTNFAAYAQGGLMFFRESSSRIYTDVRVAQNVLPVSFSNFIFDTGSKQDLYPTEFTFSVGIGW